MEHAHPSLNALTALTFAIASVGVVGVGEVVQIQLASAERSTLPAARPERKTRIHDPNGQLYQPNDEPLGIERPQNRGQRRAQRFGHVARTFDARIS